MGRRKSAPQTAPSTVDEAIDTIGRYLGKIAVVDEARADADAAIAAIQAQRDQFVAPLLIEIEDLFLQLRAWWAVAAPAMTKGKRKSIELAGALIGERTTPPSLKLPKGKKVGEMVSDLLAALAGDFLVTKHSLDKPAIIKALRAQIDPEDDELAIERRDQQILRDKLKLTVSQRDEFFIDRAAPKDPDPETVPVPAPAIAEARS
jgi:phage host-nuclease inhibitor protein Gam